jgi:hypothetical protein
LGDSGGLTDTQQAPLEPLIIIPCRPNTLVSITGVDFMDNSGQITHQPPPIIILFSNVAVPQLAYPISVNLAAFVDVVKKNQ